MQVEKLKTIDADTLLSTPMRKTLFVVDGLIPQGLSVLSGSSKIGKSWLMLWLGIQVARGQPVWEFETHKSDVLYLCLEDTYARIQSRLYQIADEAPPELRIATTSFQIGNGLEQQIEQYLSDFPKTKLVIIDTFQKVRDSKSTGGKSGMYAGDYDDVSALKNISDKYGIAVVVVHHVRKLKDVSDPFNEVSGSTGITGAADTNFVLKRSRANETGTLLATGRDIAYQELTVKFDNRSHLWELVERKDMEDIHREEIPKFIFRLVDYISDHKEWQGTATELLTQVNETEIIRKVGTITPALARPLPDGGYELISGHRRLAACQVLGIETMPVIVREMSDDEAVIAMVDANLQRETILPSEKAFAYKMKLDAIKHQGKTSVQVAEKLLSVEKVAEEAGESKDQVRRYIRLTYLIPELLSMVDENKIAFNPAVEISYLDRDEQLTLLDAINMNDCTPSHAQSIRLKKMSQDGLLTADAIYAILSEEKPNQKEQIKLPRDELRKYFPQNYSDEQIKRDILKGLELLKRQRERNRDAR